MELKVTISTGTEEWSLLYENSNLAISQPTIPREVLGKANSMICAAIMSIDTLKHSSPISLQATHEDLTHHLLNSVAEEIKKQVLVLQSMAGKPKEMPEQIDYRDAVATVKQEYIENYPDSRLKVLLLACRLILWAVRYRHFNIQLIGICEGAAKSVRLGKYKHFNP